MCVIGYLSLVILGHMIGQNQSRLRRRKCVFSFQRVTSSSEHHCDPCQFNSLVQQLEVSTLESVHNIISHWISHNTFGRQKMPLAGLKATYLALGVDERQDKFRLAKWVSYISNVTSGTQFAFSDITSSVQQRTERS